MSWAMASGVRGAMTRTAVAAPSLPARWLRSPHEYWGEECGRLLRRRRRTLGGWPRDARPTKALNRTKVSNRVSFAKSDSPSAQDVLVRERRLARPPTSRRHGHLDLTHRTHLHHQTRQRPAVPDTVPTDRRPVATRTRPCRRARRSRRDDAAA